MAREYEGNCTWAGSILSLLARCASGESGDVAELTDSGCWLVVYLRHRFPSVDVPTLEDAVQDVLVRLLEGRVRFEARTAAEAARFLTRSAENRVLDLLRTRSARRCERLDDMIDEDSCAEWYSDRYLVVDEVVELAPPQDRGFLRMYLEGWTYEEIARELGISAESARKRFSRLVYRLRVAMRR